MYEYCRQGCRFNGRCMLRPCEFPEPVSRWCGKIGKVESATALRKKASDAPDNRQLSRPPMTTGAATGIVHISRKNRLQSHLFRCILIPTAYLIEKLTTHPLDPGQELQKNSRARRAGASLAGPRFSVFSGFLNSSKGKHCKT